MYNFTDTDSRGSIKTLPAEAMRFNGLIFENEIDGYRTLGVSGRELVSKSIITKNVEGRDGVLFSLSNYNSRNLTVHYQMSSEDARSFRSNFNRLNALLIGEQVPITFNDEPRYTWYGTLGQISLPTEGLIDVVSEFEIFCADPFKYDLEQERAGIGSVIINEKFDYPILPERIKVTPESNTEVITLTSADKIIKLDDAFLSGKDIEIDFNTGDILINGVLRPQAMHFSSDLETFYLVSNGEVSVSPSMPITVSYRRKTL